MLRYFCFNWAYPLGMLLYLSHRHWRPSFRSRAHPLNGPAFRSVWNKRVEVTTDHLLPSLVFCLTLSIIHVVAAIVIQDVGLHHLSFIIDFFTIIICSSTIYECPVKWKMRSTSPKYRRISFGRSSKSAQSRLTQ